ncbi:MAG: CehA/McbA family metallohydrolase [Nitrospirota bacterium]
MNHSVKLILIIFVAFNCLFFVLTGCSKDAEDWTPQVVPYLDNVPSDIDGQGSAVLKPSEPIPTSSKRDFKLTFTVGKSGIVSGGFIMLQIPPWWGWSQPQITHPAMPGYTVVETSFTDPALQVYTLPLNRVVVFSRKRAFMPGEKITFGYGNSAQVDKFAEAEELFQVFVDADGDGHSACIANPPTLRIIARAPSWLNVTVPSQVSPGKPIEVRAAPLDERGNWSKFPAGEYTLHVIRDGHAARTLTYGADGGEKSITFRYVPTVEGIYFFQVGGPSGLRGRSNVMLSQEGMPKLKLFFGDIHGHSRMSDGTGTPEDYYSYAREVSDLDIAVLTDHADHGTIPIKGKVWDSIQEVANNAYEPGHFVTYPGFEWTNWEYGHRNVYYRNSSGPVFRSIDSESDTPQKLWNLLKSHEAMTIAHHVGGGPVATDWSVKPGPKEWLVEISSIHGTSEYYGGEASIYRPIKGAFVRDALLRGYRLGIIGSGDTHDGHPGQRTTGARVSGLLAVYSLELTREAVWEAFQQRHVYATSGPKIILNFSVADSPMGSEVKWSASRGPVPLSIRVIGCDEITSVEIIRNGEKMFDEKAEGVFVNYLLKDTQMKPGTSWYYARILQKDGNMAWSSPVWVTVQ